MDGSVATTDQFKLVGLPFWWTVSISISDASLIYKNISCLATPVFFTNDFQHIPLSLWTCFQSVFRSRSRILFLSLNRWFAHPPLRIMLSANRHGSTDKLFLQATVFCTLNSELNNTGQNTVSVALPAKLSNSEMLYMEIGESALCLFLW